MEIVESIRVEMSAATFLSVVMWCVIQSASLTLAFTLAPPCSSLLPLPPLLPFASLCSLTSLTPLLPYHQYILHPCSLTLTLALHCLISFQINVSEKLRNDKTSQNMEPP